METARKDCYNPAMQTFFRRFWRLSLIILVFIGMGIFWWNRSAQQKNAASITTAAAVRENFVKSITSSGKTQADKSVDLKFQTSGKLTWVGVKEGDAVNAYQAIAGLDSREVQKNLEKALRDYSKERNDFEETWRVTYDGKQPNDAFTDTVKRILQKNQWDLDKAVLDVELKNLALEYATLVTPIAGIITHIDTPVPGVNITPATAVFSVADPTSLVFTANVDETDVGGLSLGQAATITLDAFSEATFSGKVSYISFASETSAGGATVFPVKVAFDSPQNLRIGLNGDVSIDVDSESRVLTIPTEAVREDSNGTYVYKKSNKTYVKVPIKTGPRNDTVVVVLSGLTEDDRVVTKGFSNIPK